MAWPTTSRHARGYGAAWDKTRARILKRDAYLCRCEDCARLKRTRPATHVDHRIAKAAGGTDDDSNLRSMNAECHKRKTTIEQGRTPKVRVGLDGFPVARP